MINIDLNNLMDESIELKPFDNVIIRKDPSIEQMTYAYIEGEVGGNFEMGGDNDEARQDEYPKHVVTRT